MNSESEQKLFNYVNNGDILYLDSDGSLIVERMIKEQFVKVHHTRSISYLEQRQIWRTHVGNPRKEVTRKSRAELIDFLYSYYKNHDKADSSIQDVFERSQDYRMNTLNRAINTIERDRQAFERFFTEDFTRRPISSLTDDDISDYVNRRSKELHLSDRALKDSIQILGRVFDHAMKQEKLITSNPVRCVDLQNYYQNCSTTVTTADEKIFTADEIDGIRQEIRRKMPDTQYDPVGYAMLFAIETGVRVAEIPPLRWSDISEKGIHIHRQQRMTRIKGKGRWYDEIPYTKNERRHPKGGRYFPVTDAIRAIIDELKEFQDRYRVQSEFIFCNADGSWLNKETYSQRLRRMCERLGYDITNNHAFRMSLNSNVLIPMGLPVTVRAYLLGHSVETNERFYSYMRTETLIDVRDQINRFIHTHTHTCCSDIQP